MPDLALPRPRAAPRGRSGRAGFGVALRRQRQVLHALMLHDIKSRFFGNGLGYVVTILWPTVHIAILLLIYVFNGRSVPYGSSPLLYAATGVAPYIAWNYISRFVCLGVVQNKAFLAYPIIKPLDMMFARLALEMVSIFIITVGLIAVLAVCQVQVVPNDIGAAVAGLMSAVFLGIGFGIFNGVICMIVPLWNIAYVLVLIVFWITAGLAINPETVPEQVGRLLAWNPLLHSIEWVRQAYYADFPAHLLDKRYVLWVAAGALALGLLAERALRRFLL